MNAADRPAVTRHHPGLPTGFIGRVSSAPAAAKLDPRTQAGASKGRLPHVGVRFDRPGPTTGALHGRVWRDPTGPTRSRSDGYVTGVTWSVQATPGPSRRRGSGHHPNGGIGRVTETLPAGFAYVSSTHDSAGVSVNGQEVRFTLQGDLRRLHGHRLQDGGVPPFSGMLRDSDRANHTVGGATT